MQEIIDYITKRINNINNILKDDETITYKEKHSLCTIQFELDILLAFIRNLKSEQYIEKLKG